MQNQLSVNSRFIQKSDAWRILAIANAKKYKSIVYMRDKLGLTFKQIAERMNYSYTYVHDGYNRAYMLLGKDKKPPQPKLTRKTVSERAKLAAQTQPLIDGVELSALRERIRLEKYRTVLFLRENRQYLFREIAEEMGYSKPSAEALYRRAVKLREQRPEKFA